MAGPTAAEEPKAWELLASLRPEDVVRTAGVTFLRGVSLLYHQILRNAFLDFTEQANSNQRRPGTLSSARSRKGFFRGLGPEVSGACDGNERNRRVSNTPEHPRRGYFHEEVPCPAAGRSGANVRERQGRFPGSGSCRGGEVLTIADASLRLYSHPRAPSP
jgi:hypothetical protein